MRIFLEIKHWSYDKNGDLNWNNKPVFKLVDLNQYKKPVYIYDLDEVKRRAQFFVSNAPKSSEVYFAMKANSHPQILKTLISCGIGMDVVSYGEIKLALAAGCDPKKIIFSGVGKTKFEIKKAIELQIHQINVESISELQRIANLTKEMNQVMSVVLRVNPDVNVETHPYIATGFRDNKFGIDQSYIDNAIEILITNPQLQYLGLSQHIGSQIFNLSDFSEALNKLISIDAMLRKKGFASSVLDVGGGLGIFYDQDNESNELQLCSDYMNLMNQDVSKSHLSTLIAEGTFQLQFEPGRWLVGHSGFLLSQIQYIKETQLKKFLILDTGMHHLMRPCLYEAYHEIRPLKFNHKTEVYDVVGPICESSDFLARDRQMPQVLPDEFVIIADCGAYGYTMASQYNAHELPEEVLIFG